MDDFTELRMEHLLAMKSSCGLRLYGWLKINNEWTFDISTIDTMLNDSSSDLPDTMRALTLDVAVQDINTNTDLNIRYVIDGTMIKFEIIK